MRLGFDAKRALQNATGLGNYSRDVLRILARHRPGHAYLAYSPPGGRFALPEGVELRRPDRAPGRLLGSAWRLAGIAAQAHRDGVELFHGLSGELPIGIEDRVGRSVVTVHDLIFERFPDLYGRIDRRIYRWKFRSAIRRADLVVAISEQTARDLVELYGADRARIRVVYQGCRPDFHAAPAPGVLEEARRRLALPERFLLSVGTIEPRKNAALAVRALAGLPGVHLLLVGREMPYARAVRDEAARLGVDGRVRFLPAVEPGDLVALYRLAAAAVQPSFYEGFGIPIVEALASGCPVVTTRGGVFPEAGGPESAYVDPRDPEELRAALSAILGDEGRRERMRAAGLVHARRFSDEAIAGALWAVYEEALGRPAGGGGAPGAGAATDRRSRSPGP